MNDTSQIKNTQNNGTINNLNISRNSNVDEPFKSRNKFYQEYLRKFQNYTIKIKDKLHRNRKYELITLILSIIAIIFYIIGLQGCYGDEVYCLAKLGLFFYLKIIILNSISCICLCVALVLMTFRKASPLHLLYIIPIFLIMMMADQGTNLAHHGYFNTLGYIALLIIFYPISSFIYLMIKLIKNKKYYIYIPIFIFLLALIIFCTIEIKKNTKCDGWDMGLNNTRIYNNEEEYACQINFPKSCYINIWDNKLRMENFVTKNCSKRDDTERKMLFEYIKKSQNPYITNLNAKRIGYPQINKGDYPEEEQNGMVKLSREVVKNLVDMDDLPPHLTPDKIPETYVDFNDYPDDPDSKYGKLHFNLTKNETLVEERKNNSLKNDVIFNNIILLFIDTVSRAHFIRKLPKFAKWLEKYMKYDSEDFINYQFIKFHSLGVHTLLNLKPLTFGESVLSPNGVNILNYLKEKGYITAQANNYCSPQPYQVRPSFDNSNVTNGYFDHELISLFCEPNYFRPENPFPFNRGNCAIFRRCLYGYDTFDHLFNYSKLFWRTYNGSRRFLRLSSMDSHEATRELINLIDEPLTNFFEDLYKNGDLNDTIIFLFSDHGNHMSPHLSLMPTDDLGIEKIMPFFFLLVPKKYNNYTNKYFLDEFYDNLYKNQQSLSTCFDIHDTIMHIIFNESDRIKAHFSPNGTSLFKRINDKKRTCDDYPEIYEKKSPGTLTCNCIKNNLSS
jgi:hypothetical protein